jgi:LPXTG-motif cell wall-anchored protein
MSEAPSKAKIKRPLRGGSITKTVGAEAEESKVTELFFNTNVSDIIEMGAGIQSVPSMNLSLIGGKVKLSAAKQGTEEDAWTKVISGLPAADANGNTYYYWIEEIPVDGYIASYDNNGINAVSAAGTQTITITNTRDTSPPTLPEAGSTGTKFYTAIGGIMLILSAAGYTTIKRRRWFEE